MKPTLILTLLLGACGPAAGLAAETNNALYLMAGLDEKLLGNQDADEYFNLNSGQIGAVGDFSGVVHLGMQLGRYAALEVSVDLGNLRNNDVTYDNGGFATREVNAQWNVQTYSLTPSFTMAWPGWVSSLGLRTGFSVLGGHVVDQQLGQSGSYDQTALTPDVGILLRASSIFLRHFSLGLELGYDYIVFNSIQDSNGTGTYSGLGSPEHDVSTVGHNGAQTSLDYSGPHVAVLVGLWGDPPVSRDSDAGGTQGK